MEGSVVPPYDMTGLVRWWFEGVGMMTASGHVRLRAQHSEQREHGEPLHDRLKDDNRSAMHAAHCLDAQYKHMRAVAMTLLLKTWNRQQSTCRGRSMHK